MITNKYVSYWIMYAQRVDAIFDVYNCMQQHDIGKRSLYFYDNYSRDLERFTRDFKKVDKVFRTGLKY
jgi:hypothetical protein